MPFNVKAVYGRSAEMRKLTFDSFPSYEQLYNQLYRVFPISHTYYLSKLLFSPDSSKSSILISKEVHNAEQWDSCTAPYHTSAWSNATLRFTVFDETPHKLPAGFVADNTSLATLTGGNSPAFFASASHIPPPPIILSAASSSQALMDVDSTSAGRYSPGSTSTFKPQHQHDPQSVTAGTPGACCAVSQGKVEMEQIVSRFKDDLDRILKSSFSSPAPAPPSFMPPLPPSSFCLFKYCTTCAKIFQGPWFACEKCSIVVCLGCHENQNSTNSFCVAAMAPHIMKKEVCAACPVDDAPKMGPSAPFSYCPPFAPWSSLPLSSVAAGSSAQWTPAQQCYNPVYPFGGPTPFIPETDLPRAPAPAVAAPLPPLPVPAVAQVPEAPAPPAPPVIHRGVICDMCDNVVEGIRHKCLDCSNYDLCTPCIASGSAERHNPFHEFLEIKEPGRVIVHTVYSGDGERDAPSNSSARTAPSPQADEQPAVHFATCNLCDSRIRGDRYRNSITREQHPHHAFVKLANASDFITRADDMHFVTCDGCSQAVYGVRYKCMHPECPDFDLCASCEAFPIPVHPSNHPMLKMKSPSTVVPTVYRVGQTTLIDREDVPRGRSPAPIQRSRSRSPSFGRGYMVNPSLPILEYHPAPLSPRYAPPRQPSPMMMPGGLYDEPAFARQPQPSFLPMAHPYATASRFSHSPSPSPPLFRAHSRSPSPPRLSRQASWPAPAQPEVSRWNHFEAIMAEQAREREEREEEELRERDQFARDLADTMAQERREAMEQLAEAHRVLEHRVEQQQMRWSAPIPAPVVVEPAFPSFWPKSSEELRHLMQHDHEPPVIDLFSRLSVQEEAAVMDSPLTNEALLNRPVEMAQANKAPVTSFNHSLAALLNGYESEPEIEKEEEPVVVKTEEPTPAPLRASFVDDVTLPDGQIFPPGAEFMKCWQMVNSGGVEWPASTELVYVAGERLAREHGGPAGVSVGMVKIGAQVELWTGELKAPDAPGRYVSYWRLRDGQGNLFGDSIWIDINVTETRSNSNESSLSSSSIIVMPRGAQSVPTSSGSAEGAASHVSHGQVEEEEDDSSEHGSDASSVSLISVPTSEDEEWASVPAPSAEDSEPQGQRYVVLYDDTSSSDEE
ncbi:hypothetical protein B0H17DRAFT_1081087 [Mycena rosella]|uniref:ZZ-type domain-containing protein n=1 Tax=Mycena rosella TaxID=1033263 RepID=A0AAD7D294_MYCRO|nr:hypothetical protein B0H17DRAFT_1081087 [Mycena rosella]